MISLAKNFMMNKSKIEETLVQGENKRKFQLHNVPYSHVFMPAVCENPFQNNEYIYIYIYIYMFIYIYIYILGKIIYSLAKEP